jgi:hypothetical protein
MTIRIELDIVADFFETDAFQNDLTKHDVLYTVGNEFGPAGGHPLVEFIAPRPNIEALLADWDYAEDEIEMLIDGE